MYVRMRMRCYAYMYVVLCVHMHVHIVRAIVLRRSNLTLLPSHYRRSIDTHPTCPPPSARYYRRAIFAGAMKTSKSSTAVGKSSDMPGTGDMSGEVSNSSVVPVAH